MNQEDTEHVRLLAIFHYVVAGLAGLFACIPVLYLVFGILMLSGTIPERDDGVTRLFGIFVVAFSGIAIILGFAFCLLLVLSGTYLKKRVHYTFCLVMAGVACVFMPFGTVLGILTMLVLMRPSVKESFASPGPTVGASGAA